jgi:oligopeptide/dipeptide ABC transporter ATP-binding protein
MAGGEVVLRAERLFVSYGEGESAARAVNDVTIELHRGEILGLVGESGSGKSTLAFAMTRLLRPPGQIAGGRVTYFDREGTGHEILEMGDEELRRFRWAEIAMVFQSAMNALNPVLTLRSQIGDTLAAHEKGMGRRQREQRARELLRLVGIPPDRIGAYPHELSGGMRQRAMIALALALDPDVIIMDEPTTALDVVMQRQILDEVRRLRDDLGFSVVFITHDLSLLIELADTIAVMYGGRLVELAPARELYVEPRHPYSDRLLKSFPMLSGPRRELTGIPGTPPDLRIPQPGCPFVDRCPLSFEMCVRVRPQLAPAPEDVGEDRAVACHLYAPGHEAPAFGPDRPAAGEAHLTGGPNGD